MDTRRLWGERRGVSPVIGVVLMVAITVLLAATSATFFLGIGDESFSDRTPTVAMAHDFGVESSSYVLDVKHAGGNTVSPETLRFVVANAACDGSGDPNGRYTPAELDNTDSEIAAGSRFTLSKSTLGCGSDDLDLSSARVTVVWIGDEGASSSTLWRWRGPGG